MFTSGRMKTHKANSPAHQGGGWMLAFGIALVVLGAAVAMLYGAGRLWYAGAPVALIAPQEGAPRFTIQKGQSAATVAQSLARQGIDLDPRLVQLALRLRGDASRIKPGVYAFVPGQTVQQLLDRLVQGDVLLSEVRFIEGWTARQALAALQAQPDLQQSARSLDDKDLLARLKLDAPALEGWLHPSTYRFAPGTTDLEILQQAIAMQKKRLEEAWQRRSGDSPLRTSYELLILASIVEKETGLEKDRAMVAGVFINRLRRGMMLQSDPTTIYGMGERFKGNLRRMDLQTDTVYNTYTRNGLPPTPIALPGMASLLATAQPATTKALYFVARGDGSSEFSETLEQHNRAVARFQLNKSKP
jgi:UPF0755 protein